MYVCICILIIFVIKFGAFIKYYHWVVGLAWKLVSIESVGDDWEIKCQFIKIKSQFVHLISRKTGVQDTFPRNAAWPATWWRSADKRKQIFSCVSSH